MGPSKLEPNKIYAIFIHGANRKLQNAEYWNPLLGYIIKYFVPVQVDLFGHGQSITRKSAFSHEDHINAIIALIDHLKSQSVEKIVLIGRSYGGGIAMQVAARYNKYLDGLGLIAPVRPYIMLRNWNKSLSVLWDAQDPVVSFENYPQISDICPQSKLFLVGPNSINANTEFHKIDEIQQASHVPELFYPDLFERFLMSLSKV